MESFDPSKIPIADPPDGQVSNLVDGPSRAWIALLAVYITFPITVVFVLLRLYTRFYFRQVIGWDDYFCIGAALATIVRCGMMIPFYGNDVNGRHSWDIPFSAFSASSIKENATITGAYFWAAALTKLSLLALYLRIFSPSHHSKVMTWAGIVFTMVSHATLFIVYVVLCVPNPNDERLTDPGFLVRISRDTSIVFIALSAVSIATDFYVATIPVSAMRNLKMSLGKKIGVSALFAIGLLACVCCVVALVPRVDIYRNSYDDSMSDTIWVSVPSTALSVAEINLGIICACVPVVFPIFKAFGSKLTSTSSNWRHYWTSKYQKSGEMLPTTTTADTASPKGRFEDVPRIRVKSLLPSVLGSRRSQHRRSQGTATITQTTEIEMVPYSEIEFNYTDYHTYFGNGLNPSHHATASINR